MMTTEQDQLSYSSMLLEGLSEQARKDFAEAMVERRYANAERLFIQNAHPDGIFLLRSGRVKLLAGSATGKKMLVHIAGPGEVLGLSAIAGKPHEVTAECLGHCKANFIPRSRFVELMRSHPEAGIAVALALSEDLDCAYERVRALRSQLKTPGRSPSSATATTIKN